MGGEPRKSENFFATIESEDPANFCRAFPRNESWATGKHANSKVPALLIVHRVSNDLTSGGNLVAALVPMMITGSENTGDVTAENTSMTMV